MGGTRGKGRKPALLTQKQQKLWEKDINLISVIQCKCGRVHEIRKRYKSWFLSCSSCGYNIIFGCMLNRARNKILYKSKYLYSDNITKYDIFR